jgi:hypothetical protein
MMTSRRLLLPFATTTATVLLLLCCLLETVNSKVATPTKSQLDYTRTEFGAIIHFEMATFNGSQGMSLS